MNHWTAVALVLAAIGTEAVVLWIARRWFRRVWDRRENRVRLELSREAKAHAEKVMVALTDVAAKLRERLSADIVVLKDMETKLFAKIDSGDSSDTGLLPIIERELLAREQALFALATCDAPAPAPVGRPGGYGRRGQAQYMNRDAHSGGCLVAITIRGRRGSGRSSVASLIESMLTAAGVRVVDNTDHDAVGTIQAGANVRRIGFDMTVVIRSETVS